MATPELRWTARPYRDGDLDGAWYAIACTDDPAVNAAVAAEAERARVFCVRADDAPAGSAVTPAVGRARRAHRRRARRRPPAALGRRAHRAGRGAGRRDRLDGDAEPVRPGVALVGGGPGDPELITVRGRRLLARADVVVTDRLGPRDLLDELAPHVEVIDASKIPYGRAMNQARINELLIDHARAGRFVVRLKGGDPYVFGRGFEEVLACAEAGVPVTVVPGVTSAFAVPAVADVPVSHRGVAHEIVVVSGHVAPGDPQSLVDWDALGPAPRHHRPDDGRRADRGVRATRCSTVGGPADTPVAVVQDGTTRIQRSVRTTLATVAADVRAPRDRAARGDRDRAGGGAGRRARLGVTGPRNGTAAPPSEGGGAAVGPCRTPARDQGSEGQQAVEEAPVAAQGQAQVLGRGPVVVEALLQVAALVGEQPLDLVEQLTDQVVGLGRRRGAARRRSRP